MDARLPSPAQKKVSMKSFNIEPLNQALRQDLQAKIDGKTKPLGALGKLEELALHIGMIQQSTKPKLTAPHMLVFAADHGIATQGVSAYPQEVTWQMVMNFIRGGAAINVFCRQHSIQLYVVDAGVNHDFQDDLPGLMHQKVAKGTAPFNLGPAMSMEQASHAIELGAQVVSKVYQAGCNIIGFGEMGIGNTSSASALMSVALDLPVEQCVGRGTGLDDEAVKRKIEVLREGFHVNGKPPTPLEVLATYGGFEIAQMAGAMLQAVEHRMVVLVDGFICSAAFLMAQQMNSLVRDYAIFCHCSGEKGHRLMLEALEADPLLDLNMRLGEGTGAAVAVPLIQSAVAFLNEMASFEEATVSTSIK